MAYCLTHFWPGGTEEQYKVTLDAVTEAADGKRPELFHAGGPTEGGILISAVYESKEACDRFVAETLMPLMPIAGGLVGPPQQRGAEVTVLEGLASS
jgi:selenophosphate synthase